MLNVATENVTPSMASTVYVETSALLGMLFEGDTALRTPLNAATRIVTSALTLVEADRGLRRAAVDGRVNTQQYRSLARRLNGFTATCEVIALDPEVLQRARQPFPYEPVRTLDALHLASVQIWAEEIEPITVASHDNRVRENARALGYTVIPL